MDDLWNGLAGWNFGEGLPWERGEDLRDVPRREAMSWRRRRSNVAMIATTAALTLAVFGGCKTQEKKAEPASSVVVETQAVGIHLRTERAEFVLSAEGNLSGRLKNGAEWLTLDEVTPGAGVAVSSGKKEVSDFVRELAQAQIQPVNGKLGALGKRVV